MAKLLIAAVVLLAACVTRDPLPLLENDASHEGGGGVGGDDASTHDSGDASSLDAADQDAHDATTDDANNGDSAVFDAADQDASDAAMPTAGTGGVGGDGGSGGEAGEPDSGFDAGFDAGEDASMPTAGTGGVGGDSGGASGDGGTGGCTPQTWYRDADRDNFGNANITTQACSRPSGYVGNDDDCYDGNNDAKPQSASSMLADFHVDDRGDGSYDYDCDGEETKFWTQMSVCATNESAGQYGWVEFCLESTMQGCTRYQGVPACGVIADWKSTAQCPVASSMVRQRCR